MRRPPPELLGGRLTEGFGEGGGKALAVRLRERREPELPGRLRQVHGLRPGLAAAPPTVDVDVQVRRGARQQAPVAVGLDVQFTIAFRNPLTPSDWSGSMGLKSRSRADTWLIET